MRLATWFASSLAAVALCAPLALATGDAAHEASSALTRPDGSPQHAAHGACSVRDGADFQRFSVVVEGLSGDGAFHVWLGDGHDTLNDLGEMARHAGAATFERTTREGGELPYGVDSVRALADRRVEVRDGEQHVVVHGSVPAIAEDPPHDDPPATDTPPADAPYVARATFHRTDAAGDHEPTGTITAIRRADSSGLRIEVSRLARETGYLLYMGAGDALSLVDDFRTNGDGGARLVYDTIEHEGAALPLGADSVAALAGYRVEIRDGDGRTILYAEVPSVETHHDTEAVHHTEHHEDAATGTDVRIVVDLRPDRGHEDMTMHVRDIPRHADAAGSAKSRGPRFVVVLLQDADGSMVPVAAPRVRRGRAKARFTSRRGRELPLGVESLRDLSGRDWQLYVDGARVADGTLPQL